MAGLSSHLFRLNIICGEILYLFITYFTSYNVYYVNKLQGAKSRNLRFACGNC